MEAVDEIYKWLIANHNSKKTLEVLLSEMKDQFLKLGLQTADDGKPTSLWMLALAYLHSNYREVKSTLGNKDCTVIIYK